jgi:hypothetical protein
MSIGFWWERQKEMSQWEENRRRQEDNNKMYLRNLGWDGIDWIGLA